MQSFAIATNSWSIDSCATGSRPGIYTAATAHDSAASTTTWSTTRPSIGVPSCSPGTDWRTPLDRCASSSRSCGTWSRHASSRSTAASSPAIHSTDTHGTNHVNFALLHQFGYRFAPRYRNVQKALNRGEAYHQLRRAIAYAHGGRFRVRSQHEQEVWNECARLVGNAVVYYNALILSEALAELERRGGLYSAEILKRVFPVAWQHINFYGRYQFDEDFTPVDLERLRQQLSTEEVSRLYATG